MIRLVKSMVLPAVAAIALLAGPGTVRADEAPASGAPGSKEPAASTSTAIVTDQYNVVMTVTDPSFYRPSSGFSLGGGGKGAKLKELRIWNGNARQWLR